ncbi:MAG TPA: RNA polymerase sigma factor [Phycisphaerae bacterium]|nr:RNA polymerase sigma factor [Phycisphaerae bacterium]HNU45190.1 RNA polymerase sigma factor [Phycisphaerae bacterium]
MRDSDQISRERAEEQRVVQRARAGDRGALRQLVEAHKDRLYSFVRRMVRNHHDAEEICQEAFLKAFGALDAYCSAYRFSTWLFTIAYRVCLNSLRRRRAYTGEVEFATLSLPGGEAGAAAAESEEAARLREMVWEAVDRLSPPQRATVLLFYRHDQSCHEIARVLQVPVATVKSHLHRARARLRQLLVPVTEGQVRAFCNLTG